MPDLLAGSIVRALDTPPTQQDTQSATVTTTSTTFTTSGTSCAVTFTAPTTGRVRIHVSSRMVNSSATSGTLASVETREGATVGSGTVIESASDSIGVAHYGSTFAASGKSHTLIGLTPGSVYNSRILMRSSNGADTASFANRYIEVTPAT